MYTHANAAYPAAGEIHRLPAQQSRQHQTTKSRAGSGNAGPGSNLIYWKRSLVKETLPFIRGDRFDGNGWSRFVGSRFAVHAIDLYLIVHSRLNSGRFTRVDQPTIIAAQRIPPVGENQNRMRTTKRM